MYQEIKQEEINLDKKLEVTIIFDDSAIDELIRQAIEMNETPGSLAVYLATKLEYGLKLLRDRTGIGEYVISGEAVTDMDGYIDNLFKKKYQKEKNNTLPQPQEN